MPWKVKKGDAVIRVVDEWVEVAAHKGYVCVWEDDPPVPPPPEPTAEQKAEAFEAERTAAIKRLGAKVEQLRAKYVTLLWGQDGTYMEKKLEALRYSQDDAPDPAGYDYLREGAKECGLDLATYAARILARVGQLSPVNAKIEGKRDGAMLRLASVPAGDYAALAAAELVDWEDL